MSISPDNTAFTEASRFAAIPSSLKQGSAVSVQDIARDYLRFRDFSPFGPSSLANIIGFLVRGRVDSDLLFSHFARVSRYFETCANLYHDEQHTGNVVLWANMINPNLVTVAMSHDDGHSGKKNPPDDIMRDERIASDQHAQTMRQYGANENDIARERLYILGTSIDGPSDYLKFAARAYNNDEVPDHDKIAEAVASLPQFANRDKDSFITQLAEMKQILDFGEDAVYETLSLHAADIMPSILEGEVSGEKLTQERNLAGYDKDDFTTYGARLFFLNAIVGREMFEIVPALQRFKPLFDHAVVRARLGVKDNGYVQKPAIKLQP